MIDKGKIAVVAYTLFSRRICVKDARAERVGVVNEANRTWRDADVREFRTWVTKWACITAVGIGGWLVMPLPAWATHEVDHRFVVSGSVRAADGTPKPDVKVVVAHPRTKLSESVLTDRNGGYSALLHLHDPDAGDPVTVTAGEETKTIRADFDPKDHHTPRLARVDFGVATQADGPRSSAWMYGVAGGVFAAALAVYWRRRASKAGRPSRGGGPGRRKAKSRA
jgi:hypothetical protein